MAGASGIPNGRSHVATPALAGVVTLVLAVGLTGWTGGGPARALDLLWVLGGPGARAALWLASAWGLGLALRRWWSTGAATIPALGVAALLTLDGVAGRLGLLQIGGGVGAWLLLAPGLIQLGVTLVSRRKSPPAATTPRIGRWLVAAAAPVAVLLVAAASAPGWLWASEFGGYDALSYHLQLPREWCTLGRMQGLPHNVYAHLPSGVEAAYYHLFALGGGDRSGAFAAQLLHAGLALLTAGAVHAFAARHAGRTGGAAAMLVVLATPWVIVTGSLAYNEMAVALFLAAGLGLLDEHAGDAAPAGATGRPLRTGLALGLLLGAACAAKLTAVGFVAVPAAAWLVTSCRPGRRTLVTAGAAAVMMLVVLAPWLIANAIETGNPVFPFLPGLLGTGVWTADQAAIWAHGHGADTRLLARLVEAGRQLLWYGIGPAPADGGPWTPQWSIIPWLALAAGLAGLTRRVHRPLTARLLLVLVLQAAFWLLFTHVKSRFMLPAIVPAALLVGVTTGAVVSCTLGRVVVATLAALALLPVVLFAREAGRAPAAAVGALAEIAGDADATRLADPTLSPDERRAILAQTSPAFWINHRLPPGSRVLGVGEATPFYYDRTLVYRTTWDRGPLSPLLRAHAGDPAAWLAALRAEGFTHLLVNTTMLDVWAQAGWNDPLVTTSRVIGAADTHATVERRWPYGVVLYRLEEPTAG